MEPWTGAEDMFSGVLWEWTFRVILVVLAAIIGGELIKIALSSDKKPEDKDKKEED